MITLYLSNNVCAEKDLSEISDALLSEPSNLHAYFDLVSFIVVNLIISP